MNDYEFHPLCEMFPVMLDEELTELAEDIKAEGLRQPILLLDGKIIDGRNRYLACVRAEVPPRFKVFTGDAKSLVKSLNIFRRHLTDQQRAVLAAELVTKKSGDAIASLSARKAAKVFQVKHDSINRAVKVKEKGSVALRRKVANGSISLSRAAKIADKPKSEQAASLRGPCQGVTQEQVNDRILNAYGGGRLTGTVEPEAHRTLATALTKDRVLSAYDAEIAANLKNYKDRNDMVERVRAVLEAL